MRGPGRDASGTGVGISVGYQFWGCLYINFDAIKSLEVLGINCRAFSDELMQGCQDFG